MPNVKQAVAGVGRRWQMAANVDKDRNGTFIFFYQTMCICRYVCVCLCKYIYTYICVSHFPCRPDRGVLNGVLASQPDPPAHDGRGSKVPLDAVLLPELRHPPPGGRHLLLPELGHQSLPLQLVLQAVPPGVRAGAAVSPDHRTRQHAQREELPRFFGALAAATADKDSAS